MASPAPTTTDDPTPTPPPVDYFAHGEIIAHGTLMLTTFGFLLPGAAFLMRYRPKTTAVTAVHAGMQMLAALAIALAGVLILTNPIHCKRNHRFVGRAILAIVGMQVAIGITQLVVRSLASAHAFAARRWLRYMHRFLAVTLFAMALAQIPMGISHGATIDENPGHPFWIAFYISILLWLSLVAVFEARRVMGVSSSLDRVSKELHMPILHSDSGADLMMANGADGTMLTTIMPQTPNKATNSPHRPISVSSIHPASNPGPMQVSTATSRPHSLASYRHSLYAQQVALNAAAEAQARNLPVLTWRMLDEQVQNHRRLLVIGPGGVIFDVERWITSHPGGYFTLFDVIGTSITNDYFTNVADFDKSQFQEYTARPSSALPHRPASMASSLATSADMDPSGATNFMPEKRITARDWAHVIAARRTHAHTPAAIARLRAMAVGRIAGGETPHFDAHEYRRYALTATTLVSPEGLEPKMVRLTFTLLYPHATYPGEPAFFLPGHVVEVRVRVTKKRHTNAHANYVSRFYTPITGNMTQFEICVKIKRGGALSELWARAKPTDRRQYQVRGPFGALLINPARPLPVANGCWDHILFLTVGSGNVIPWQILSWYLLQPYFAVAVTHPHMGTAAHELTVSPPGLVRIKYALHSGWVWATDLTRHIDGYVPLQSLLPFVGRAPKFSVVAAGPHEYGLLGREIESCAEAFPHQLTLHYRVKEPLGATRTDHTIPPAVRVSQGRIDHDFVAQVAQSSGLFACAEKDSDNVRVVVCGPQHFLDAMYAVVADLGLEDATVLLPTNSYLTGIGDSRPTLLAPDQIPPHMPTLIPRLPVRADDSGDPCWFYALPDNAQMHSTMQSTPHS